jgi:hypothetical protein
MQLNNDRTDLSDHSVSHARGDLWFDQFDVNEAYARDVRSPVVADWPQMRAMLSRFQNGV